MRYAFIEAHRERWPIAVQCGVLQVSPQRVLRLAEASAQCPGSALGRN